MFESAFPKLSSKLHYKNAFKRGAVDFKNFQQQGEELEESLYDDADTSFEFEIASLSASSECKLNRNMGSLFIQTNHSTQSSPSFFNFEKIGYSPRQNIDTDTDDTYETAQESPIGLSFKALHQSSPLGKKQKNKDRDCVLVLKDLNLDGSTILETTNNNSFAKTKLKRFSIHIKPFFLESSESLVEPIEPPTDEAPPTKCHESIIEDDKIEQKRPIFVNVTQDQLHQSCYTCQDSNIKFETYDQYYMFEDKSYCKQHYHSVSKSICQVCKEYIEGECLENNKTDRFHTECLRCFVCQHTIQDDYTLINDSIPMCTMHDLGTLIKEGVIEL